MELLQSADLLVVFVGTFGKSYMLSSTLINFDTLLSVLTFEVTQCRRVQNSGSYHCLFVAFDHLHLYNPALLYINCSIKETRVAESYETRVNCMEPQSPETFCVHQGLLGHRVLCTTETNASLE